jgi:glycosyltransferase involved in cell wall biosynthesis
MKASAGKHRILMLLGNNPFPQDARVRQEAFSLAEAGYHVSVVCPRANGQPRRELVRGVHVYRYRKSFDAKRPLGYAFEYLEATVAALVLSIRVAFEEGFDVIHAHNPPDTYGLVAAVYKLFGRRFVYDHHDLSPEMYEARFPHSPRRSIVNTLIALEKLSHRLADHVIATNESYRLIAIERGGVDPGKVSVVRNGPDLERIRPVEGDEALGAQASTILGYVGVMGYQDGLDHLLRAVHHLVYDLGRTDAYAVLIGKGDAWTEMKQMATALEIDDYVRFTGHIPDDEMLQLLSTADICLVPDPSNAFTDRSTMIKIMEYMALGKPIVAFDLPEHRVTAQEAAMYARPNDDLEFARTIAALIDDPQRRAKMGEFGRRRAVSELSWDCSVPHLLAVYAELFADGQT